MTKEDFTNMKEVQESLAEINAHGPYHVSDVKDIYGNQYINLVQEGGGVLGIALLGFTYILEKANVRFWRLAGTSAGAINTLFLASIKEKHEAKSEDILEELANVDLKKFVDGNKIVINTLMSLMENPNYISNSIRYGKFQFLIMLIGFGILCFYYNAILAKILFVMLALFVLLGFLGFYYYNKFKNSNWGLCKGVEFHNWLKEILAKHNVNTLTDLKNKAFINHQRGKLSMSNENDFHQSDVTFISCDISNGIKVEFPFDKDLYNINDDIHPADFVRASMSIPIFFETYKITNKEYNNPDTIKKWKASGISGKPNEVTHLIDGGVVSNFPINIFHNPKVRIPRLPVIGLILEEDSITETKKDPLKSVMSLVVKIFNTVRYHSDKEFLRKNEFYEKYSVQKIEVSGFNWLNFAMTDEDKKKLFVKGVEAGMRYLRSFDWDGYKEDRKSLYDID